MAVLGAPQLDAARLHEGERVGAAVGGTGGDGDRGRGGGGQSGEDERQGGSGREGGRDRAERHGETKPMRS